MEIIQQQIGALKFIVQQQQKTNRRQNFLNLVLLAVIFVGGFVAAVRPVGDATFDKITCKAWQVVDKDEKTRIVAATNARGDASMVFNDSDGKPRITAGTISESGGAACAVFFDSDKKVRIMAGTEKGAVILPTTDLNPTKKP